MTVSLDPSDLRRGAANPARSQRLRLRQIGYAAGGGLALIAFTVGAFSFFSTLADPRVRSPRPAPVAVKMPDLKDGVPALAPVASAEPAARAETAFNLPPTAPKPQREAIGLRTEPQPAAAEPRPAPAAEATGSVATRPPAGTGARPTPPIENVTIVAFDQPSVPLVAPARIAGPLGPAKAESVRAKAAEPRAFASLPPEPMKPEAMKTEAVKPEPVKAAAAAKPKPKVAQARATAAKPVAEASAEPAAEAAPKAATGGSDDPEVMGVKVWGGRQIRDGFKAVFGGNEQN